MLEYNLLYILSLNIYLHLDKHKILTDQQQGFQSRRSCEAQLIGTINDTESFNAG